MLRGQSETGGFVGPLRTGSAIVGKNFPTRQYHNRALVVGTNAVMQPSYDGACYAKTRSVSYQRSWQVFLFIFERLPCKKNIRLGLEVLAGASGEKTCTDKRYPCRGSVPTRDGDER